MVEIWARWIAWLRAAAGWRPGFGPDWVEPSNEITRAVYASLAEDVESVAPPPNAIAETVSERPLEPAVIAAAPVEAASTVPVEQPVADEPAIRAVPGRAA